MGRLVLHIGMHKTGSTTVQRFFARNRWRLRLLGIEYPHAVSPEGRRLPKHNDYFHAISHEKDHDGAPHRVYGPSARLIQDLGARVAESPRTFVLSAEGFSGEHPAFARAFAELRGRFDIRVVMVLRRQDFWVEAFYRQMVLNEDVKENRRFPEFLADWTTKLHLDYESIVGWWETALGRDAMRIAVYPDSGPVVKSFLLAAGLEPQLRFLPYSRGRENRTPAPATIEYLRRHHAVGKPLSRKAVMARERGADWEPEGYFTDDERAVFLGTYEPMNARLARRYLGRDSLFADRAPPPVWDGSLRR